MGTWSCSHGGHVVNSPRSPGALRVRSVNPTRTYPLVIPAARRVFPSQFCRAAARMRGRSLVSPRKARTARRAVRRVPRAGSGGASRPTRSYAPRMAKAAETGVPQQSLVKRWLYVLATTNPPKGRARPGLEVAVADPGRRAADDARRRRARRAARDLPRRERQLALLHARRARHRARAHGEQHHERPLRPRGRHRHRRTTRATSTRRTR